MVFPQEVTCALCGASSKQQVLASASAFGACDLDMRSPRALGWFGSALEGGRLIISQAGGTGLLLADLLRRAGRFGEAIEQARAALEQSPDETFRRLLLFELGLAGGQDVECHSTAEIEEKRDEDDRS